MATAAQITANRLNAQASTGPRTIDGKQIASANALKHGLASGFIVLPHENAAEYHSLRTQYVDEFEPEGVHEEFLVEEMAQARWRLARIRRLEGELFSGYANNATENPDHAILASMEEKGTNVANALARYAAAAERSYYKAHRTLTSDRKANARIAQAELRNEANLAEVERLDAILEACKPPREWAERAMERHRLADEAREAQRRNTQSSTATAAPAAKCETNPKSA